MKQQPENKTKNGDAPEIDFNTLGQLPSEARLQTLATEDVGAKIEEIYKHVWKHELPACLNADKHPLFFQILDTLVQDGNFSNGQKAKTDLLQKTFDIGKDDVVTTMSKVLAEKQIWHRQVTASLAKALNNHLTGKEGTTSISAGLFNREVKLGTPKELLVKLCWISYAIGSRSRSQSYHGSTLASLEDLWRGIAMNPSGRDLSKRKGANKNAHLKDWFHQICRNLKNELGQLPGKKSLQTFINRRVDEFEKKQPQKVAREGKKLRHRQDPLNAGATMNTITDNWRKEFNRLEK